ncbi:MAG: signal peptide peptidase SppA, partial [Acidobacteria bacterium]
VAEARRMTPEQVDRIAQGRVWTGRQAKDIGLVDALGGLDRGGANRKEKAGIRADARVSLVVYPARRSIFDILASQVAASEAGTGRRLLAAFGGSAANALRPPVSPFLFRRGEVLALMPFAWVR